MNYLQTSDLAKAVGIHPNTVRRYVDWGLLPPVGHSSSGYRRFTRETLAKRYRDHDISQALDLTIEEALELFKNRSRRPLVRTPARVCGNSGRFPDENA